MHQLLYRPEEAAQLLAIGRSAIYEAMRKGEIESVTIGRSRRIPSNAIELYVSRLRKTQDGI